MIRKVHILIGVLLLVALVGLACAPAAAPPPTPTKAPVQEPKPPAAVPTKAPEPTQLPAPSPTPRPVTVKYGGVPGVLANTGMYVALEKGYFKEQGITQEVVDFRLSQDVIAPLATGGLDVAMIPIMPALLNAADRGLEIKIGAGITQYRPGWEGGWIVLRKDLADSGQVKTFADLKGMKVAMPTLSSSGGMAMLKLMEQAALKPGDVELVEIPTAEQEAAFANKAIAAGVTTEIATLSGVQKGLFTKWMPLSKMFDGRLQATLMVYGPSFVKDQDLARRWMIAYLKGVRDFVKAFTTKEGRQEVVDILTKNTAIKDPKMFDLLELSYIDPNGGLDIKSLDAQYQFWVEKGLYTGKKRFQDLVDLSYVEYAAQKLGKQ